MGRDTAGVDAIEASWQRLAPPSRERGRVELIVVRLGGGEHRVPERVEVGLESGVAGDRWRIAGDPGRACQVTLMMSAVARLLCGERPLHLPGDNFLVDFDLGEESVAPGGRLRLGTVVLEISEEPHAGCKTFRERLGSDALRWVNHRDNRHLRLRGVNCRVIEPGAVAVGDLVEPA
jgi:MOSC domain-containing protein YiiM